LAVIPSYPCTALGRVHTGVTVLRHMT
jgi:hypothetical protein